MESSSGPASGEPASPYDPRLIEKEIAHLKKKKSTRHLQQEGKFFSRMLAVVIIFGVFWLYAMDPFLHAYYRGEAVGAYLYLHNYGDDRKASALGATGIFTTFEVEQLNHRAGSFQDLFPNADAASRKADEILAYLQSVKDLQEGHYPVLSAVNKLRCVVFVRTGLLPPVRWEALDPSI